ncbi:LysR family transcriptional regulator [Paraburkholderia caballeronis]|uniref:DNA-binding transcriptional regulator, LysR family n=1 Tax=Paraburkholderia caballeronis TaxID=416943 RepID=A0A1H7QJZ4_9BURK|nr:LysR family transcriptional regulator [Paraburkholderia caballeronis]PXW22505.1 LysR family transcriptional regulator [Paraburkholderia caballeronis]PXW96376.1 LysR family transcriptional regulator [Paraburkholderia caballeronis]RAJ92787.1 LysR family transcriptional regulator [Paraburkholderia caballeronis]SEE04085.1 transcriptional regulator, LysR family [Paraburkholderia caballeronis]SEL48440.1 DNA-binding transcriptional regulator, LysR family [Paraburkholderia caballeronis]
MDRFQEMQIFTRIVDRRSFTQAAEDLNLPRATVTNSIKRLEARLGVRLLERTTRQVKPTLDGDAYYQRCVRLLADLEETEEGFRDTDPKGLLRVNVQETLANHFVVPRLPAFLARYPRIEVSIGSGDQYVDLVREGVDCVLRAGELANSSMIARRVALLDQVTCASPVYIERHGDPASIDELADGHHAVNYLSPASGRPHPLEFATPDGIRRVTLPGPVAVNSAALYTGSALAGLGIVQVPRYPIRERLANGELRQLLPDCPPPSMPVSVLYPQNRQLSLRVRTFADWLVQVFAQAG